MWVEMQQHSFVRANEHTTSSVRGWPPVWKADAVAKPDVRSRILRSALQLVGREGVGALTNRAVARSSGVSLGTLTYHFEDQHALLREALELFLDEEISRLSALTEAIGAASMTSDQAAQALEALLETELERRAAKMELYLQAARDPELRPSARRCFAAYERLATGALEALGVADAVTLAPVLVAIIDGLQLRRLASGERHLKVAAPLRALLAALDTQA